MNPEYVIYKGRPAAVVDGTNDGTFVRIKQTRLHNGKEIIHTETVRVEETLPFNEKNANFLINECNTIIRDIERCLLYIKK